MYNKIIMDLNNIIDNNISVDALTFLNIYRDIIETTNFKKYQDLFDNWREEQGNKKLETLFEYKEILLRNKFFFRKFLEVIVYLKNSDDDFFVDLMFTWVVDTMDELIQLMICDFRVEIKSHSSELKKIIEINPNSKKRETALILKYKPIVDSRSGGKICA